MGAGFKPAAHVALWNDQAVADGYRVGVPNQQGVGIFLNNARRRQGAKGAVHGGRIAGLQAQDLSHPEPILTRKVSHFGESIESIH